jgi:hypothetical protein
MLLVWVDRAWEGALLQEYSGFLVALRRVRVRAAMGLGRFPKRVAHPGLRQRSLRVRMDETEWLKR